MRNPGRTLRQWAVTGAGLALAACARPAGTTAPADATADRDPDLDPDPARDPRPRPRPAPATRARVRARARARVRPRCLRLGLPILLGPKELPIRSPSALSLRGDTIEAVLNDDGHPRVIAIPAGPISSAATPAPGAEPVDGGASPGLSVPCAVAGDRFFCPDRAGAIHRTTRAGVEDRVAANARTGSRVSAALIGGTHTALAYLASRQTSEGWVSEAWMAVDEDAPVRISEDGSGATSVTLAPRGSALLAISVDARAALTAMHARTLTYEGGMHLGEDVVLFVGGPGDRRTAAALAVGATGPGLAFLPIAKDVGTFGLAIVRVDAPPRVDEPVSWSMYPNGLDPAPVAAAMGPASRTWVARVRPRMADPGSDRLLELGDVAAGEAAFAPRHVVAGTGGTPRDVSLVVDGHGALWVAWLDSSGSWLERLACK